MAEKPLDLNAGAEPENKKLESGNGHAEAEPKPRQGDQHRPYCRVHMCLMAAKSSSKGVTRYYCPVSGCEEAEKRAQPTSMIPRQPQECPVCTQRGGKKKVEPVYCVVDYRRSTFAMLKMVCPTPNCHYHVTQPRPDVASRANVMRRKEESV